jgi:hypothetical protein
MMSASVLDLSWVYSELSPNYPALGLPNRDSCTAAINNRIRG